MKITSLNDLPAIQSAGRATPVASDRLAIIYDRDNGQVRHVHRVTDCRADARADDDELRTEALRHAAHYHGEAALAGADVAFAAAEDWRPGHRHRIEAGRLVGERGRR